MENEVDSAKISLWIVLILSILLISLDTVEIIYSLDNLKIISKKVNKTVYENCFNIQLLSQMIFAFFACLAAISAMIMSMGLLINYRFFTHKLMDSYMHYNYLIFGPYLLGACILSFFYFNNVMYNCDKELKEKSFNIATFLTIFVCLIISFCITLGQSVYTNTIFWVDSIRDGPNGSKLMGKIFWKIALSRRNSNNQPRYNLQTPVNTA